MMKNPITQITLIRDRSTFVAFHRNGKIGRLYRITTTSLTRLSRTLNSSLVFDGRYYPTGNGWTWYRQDYTQ